MELYVLAFPIIISYSTRVGMPILSSSDRLANWMLNQNWPVRVCPDSECFFTQKYYFCLIHIIGIILKPNDMRQVGYIEQFGSQQLMNG